MARDGQTNDNYDQRIPHEIHSACHAFLVRGGYPPDTRQVFTNEYLTCLRSAAFSTIRFMAVTNTNGNVEWGKDHTRPQTWNHR